MLYIFGMQNYDDDAGVLEEQLQGMKMRGEWSGGDTVSVAVEREMPNYDDAGCLWRNNCKGRRNERSRGVEKKRWS